MATIGLWAFGDKISVKNNTVKSYSRVILVFLSFFINEDIMFKEKVVIVTGGASGIGKCIADVFRSEGAHVYVIDKQVEGEHFVGDIAQKEVLEAFVEYVVARHDMVDCVVNNALPLMKGID